MTPEGGKEKLIWIWSYRKHVIMAFPSFDTATNSWAPQADISWPLGPVRESEFVRFPIRVMSESEAVAFSLSGGKSWVDQHVNPLETTARGRQATSS